jgi:translocation and assembly module TamA
MTLDRIVSCSWRRRLKPAAWGSVLALGAVAPAFAETTVTGVEGALLANILAYLEIDDLACDADDFLVQRALADAVGQATDALNAYGYYAPEITTGLAPGDDCWQAEIAIVPGEPVLLREVDLSIETPADNPLLFQPVTSGHMLVPGAQLSYAEYDGFKRQLLDVASSRGYAEAAFTDSRIDVFPEERAADLVLHFTPGPRYTLGEVTVNQSGLDPEFVDSYLELEPGMPFDNRLLTSSFVGLSDSGYFQSVDVRALEADPVLRTIPVSIDLTPAPRKVLSYGFGYSTDTGPRFRFGRRIRRFNERGHQLMLDAMISPVVSEFTSIYRMPVGDPRFDWLNFNVGAKREETDTALSRSIEGGVRRVVTRPNDWARTQYLSYIVEDFEVASQTGRPHLLIPGVSWTRIRGDDALRPSAGSKLAFELRAADDQFLSDTSFVQTTAQVKWVRTVTSRGRVLLRGSAGYTVDDVFAELPPSIRFFAGGDYSIRGFDFESLGPVDENGEVIGGNRLIELSAEYEHDIKAKWSIAVFTDSGNAFNEEGLDMRTSAGIGTRWRSPVGPVRIDIAWPINDVESGAHFHISLGPDL